MRDTTKRPEGIGSGNRQAWSGRDQKDVYSAEATRLPSTDEDYYLAMARAAPIRLAMARPASALAEHHRKKPHRLKYFCVQAAYYLKYLQMIWLSFPAGSIAPVRRPASVLHMLCGEEKTKRLVVMGLGFLIGLADGAAVIRSVRGLHG